MMALITRSLQQGELLALTHLLKELNLAPYYKGGAILEGQDPILKSPHFLGEAVATALLLEAISASVIWKHRTNQDNSVKINIFDAIHYLHPVHFVWQSGYNMDLGADKVPINYSYRCKDGRHIWIQCGPHIQNYKMDI